MRFPISDELTAQWHPSKNGSLTPESDELRTGMKVWWQCDKGHEWEATLINRMRLGTGCPYCSGRNTLIGYNDLATTHPELAAQWHPTLNGSLTPQSEELRTSTNVWWQCSKKHEWQATTNNRKRGKGCPYCSNRKILAGYNDLATKSPELAAKWHPTLNGSLTASQIAPNYSKKVWWQCNEGHEWEGTPNGLINHGTKGCAVCVGQKVLAGYNDLATTHPEIAAEWHPTKNGELKPANVSKGHETKRWWLGKCGHEWEAPPGRRTSNKSGCPICANIIIVAGVNDLESVNPTLASQWHPNKNDNKLPSQVGAKARFKAWWQCNNGHEWQAYVYSRATGKGCSVCVWKTFSSKGEKEIQSLLDEHKTNYTSNTKALLKNRELDIFVQDYKLGIEFNGIYWHSEAGDKDEAYHMDKWRKCLEKDVDIFQIWEDDWNKNKKSIQNKILSLVTELSYDEKFAVKEITKKEYLKINKLDTLAEYYLGIHIGNEPSSAIALNLKGDSIEIAGYVSNYARNTSFKHLVDYIATKFGSKSIHMLSDNCAGESVMLRENGFTIAKEYEPRCYRVKNGLRYDENDDKVKPVKGKTYPRLWDAGKTLWSKTLE